MMAAMKLLICVACLLITGSVLFAQPAPLAHPYPRIDDTVARDFHQRFVGFIQRVAAQEAAQQRNAGGSTVIVYPKPNHEPATFTVLNFPVADIEKPVDSLTKAGVKLERYDGFNQDARGIMRDPNGPARNLQ